MSSLSSPPGCGAGCMSPLSSPPACDAAGAFHPSLLLQDVVKGANQTSPHPMLCCLATALKRRGVTWGGVTVDCSGRLLLLLSLHKL
jgi:hypothetical protein